MATTIDALANDPEIKPLLVEQRRMPQPDGTEAVAEAPRNFMRTRLRAERQAEAEELEGVLSDPYARKRITNPDVLKRRAAATRRDLVTQTPPATTARQRDKLLALTRACEASIREGMPTAQEMRRNPPGVADRHRRWDRAKKLSVLLWKSARQILDPHNDDKDYLNVETLRRQGMTNNPDVDAQIGGVFALTPQAKDNYDEINWKDPAFQA